MFKKKLFTLIILSLLIVPFFWIPFQSIDIGGDSSRLYFYDPSSYLENFSSYFVYPQGLGLVEPNFYLIPFLLILIILKKILISPYLIVTLFNSIKLTLGFASVYYIVVLLLKNYKFKDYISYFSGIAAGLFYILTPTMTGNWDRALLSHTQVFVNPLIFLLMLQYIETNRRVFLWFLLLTSFIFSFNFAYTSAPPFFAFFPLAILFLVLYKFSFNKKISFSPIVFCSILFCGLQAFHLIPQLVNLFDAGSYVNTRVFSTQSIAEEGIRYFTAIQPLAKVSNYVLLTYGVKEQFLTTCLPFLVLILGFIFTNKLRKLLVLTSLFYLVTLFLLSGNVTHIGSELYLRLFYIPGFSMFRNFIGQWLFVYSFFSALLIGLCLAETFLKLKRKKAIVLTAFFISIMTLTSLHFIQGKTVNKVLLENTNSKIAHQPSPHLLNLLTFLKKEEIDGKILTLPLTDSYYQVAKGIDNGVYIGPSIYSMLSGKKDFAGHQVLGQFGDDFLKLAKDKNYADLRELLAILNIYYIVHDSSPFILDENNADFLYANVRQYLPNSQSDYQAFINKLGGVKVKTFGSYNIHALSDRLYSPHIYAATHIFPYDTHSSVSAILRKSEFKGNDVLIDKKLCLRIKCDKLSTRQKISFKKISPTRYEVDVIGKERFLLVFSEAYHPSWKASIGNSTLAEHYLVNNYANGWVVESSGNSRYKITIELQLQKIFYIGLTISVISLAILVSWRVFIARKK